MAGALTKLRGGNEKGLKSRISIFHLTKQHEVIVSIDIYHIHVYGQDVKYLKVYTKMPSLTKQTSKTIK